MADPAAGSEARTSGGGLVSTPNPLMEGLDGERMAKPTVMVVFGASGDLTARKLMPAIEQLALKRLLPGGFAVVGVARTELDDDDFRRRMREGVKDSGGGGAEAEHVWDDFVGGFRYVAGDYGHPDTFDRLKQVLDELDEQRGTDGNRLYYLATPPSTFPVIIEALGREKLNRPPKDKPDAFVRIVIEKPFGRDLASAQELDAIVHRAFDES